MTLTNQRSPCGLNLSICYATWPSPSSPPRISCLCLHSADSVRIKVTYCPPSYVLRIVRLLRRKHVGPLLIRISNTAFNSCCSTSDRHNVRKHVRRHDVPRPYHFLSAQLSNFLKQSDMYFLSPNSDYYCQVLMTVSSGM